MLTYLTIFDYNRAVEEELRVEAEKHKHTREELRSSKANLQYTKTQYAVIYTILDVYVCHLHMDVVSSVGATLFS